MGQCSSGLIVGHRRTSASEGWEKLGIGEDATEEAWPTSPRGH